MSEYADARDAVRVLRDPEILLPSSQLEDIADTIEHLLAQIERLESGAVPTAATNLLRRLEHMTSDQFMHGGEKVEREALKAALGLHPDEMLDELEQGPWGAPKDH